MNLKLILWPDPLLNQKLPAWSWPAKFDYDQFETDLVNLMIKSNGIGISANQVGVSQRVMAISLQETAQNIVMYNPQLLASSDYTITDLEGCLSFPKQCYYVRRPQEIRASWQNSNQEIKEAWFRLIDARCFCHELDHLNGVVFTGLAQAAPSGKYLIKSRVLFS